MPDISPPEVPDPTSDMDLGWTEAPLIPPHHTEQFTDLTTAMGRQDMTAAAAITEDLEAAFHDEFGPNHPHTLGALAMRAHVALRAGDDLIQALTLHLQVAERRHVARATREETLRAARNAHFVWKKLARTDEPMARRTCQELLRILPLVGGEPVFFEETERIRSAITCPAA
ncbi:hypothetical protein [Streptomyces sp. NPDC048636]|uniref:hypothetical protein n=1 Tax=Streptomyces sp. NPDC048636 TaxID=3155762 RepID=UPI00342C2E75